MAKRRQSSEQRGWSRPFTLLGFFCAFAVALFLCGAVSPGGRPWHPSGVRRVYRPYLVLELPVPREQAARGPLAGTGEEIPPPHLAQMEKRGLSLAEYTRWLQNYPWGDHLKVRQGGVQYEVYFVPAAVDTTRVPIPVGYQYTLSGDGEDGFIVTIHPKK